jgi:hypothetical protein
MTSAMGIRRRRPQNAMYWMDCGVHAGGFRSCPVRVILIEKIHLLSLSLNHNIGISSSIYPSFLSRFSPSLSRLV